MTTSDYIVNTIFVLVVLRQARERRLDLSSVLVPLCITLVVARQYIHTLPTGGNDVPFVVLLAALGLTLGVVAGLATHVRADPDGAAFARAGWIACGLLVAGIGARMGFAFAARHGAGPAIASFSSGHRIGAEAWPVALVAMALCEVAARVAVVQLRARRVLALPRSIVSWQ